MENWKEINITGLEKYEISNLGNIKNVKNKRLLKNYDRKDSYSSIYLCKKSYSIHRLVGITFLPNPDNKPTINHIDKNKHNNNLENLEWATHTEQKIHSPNSIINTYRKIWQIDLENNKVKLFNSLKDAGLTINENAFKNISSCANGKTKTAYGYKWEYEQENNIVNEIWKSTTINGRKNQNYYISSYGRLKNKNRILKISCDNSGYFNFCNNLIHILVANAFIDNPHKKIIVNHKDGNKKNNNVSNLEWVTPSENTIHAINTGLRKNVYKVCHINNNGETINIYESCKDASRKLNVNTSSINKCCKGQLKSCGSENYKFKYLDNNTKIEVIDKTFKNKKHKKIDVFDINNKFIETLVTIIFASKKYNVNYKTVCAHCDNKVKHSNIEFKFKYHI